MEEKDWSRLRIVLVPYKMLLTMLTGLGEPKSGDPGFRMITSFTCVEGLPRDAQIIAHSEDISRQAICFKVWSSEFNPVPDGDVIPPLYLKLRTRELV